MKYSFTRPMIIAGALSVLNMGTGGMLPAEISTKAEASAWLAPAPHQELAAGWVADIDRAFRSPQISNIFMNVPFGSPHSTIIDLLNEAAIGVQTGHPQYARHLVRQAVNVLDETAGKGWYSQSEVRPIQAMILKKARQGFTQAGYEGKNQQLRTQAGQRSQRMDDQDRRRAGMREGGIFEPDTPYKPRPRYKDYTSEHWQSGNRPRTGERSRGQDFERERSQNIRDRGQFTQGQFEESRGMRDYDHSRDRFTQNQGRNSRDMGDADRNRDRGRFTDQDWRKHAPQHGKDLRGMRDFDRDRNKFTQDRGRNSRSMRDFDRNRD